MEYLIEGKFVLTLLPDIHTIDSSFSSIRVYFLMIYGYYPENCPIGLSDPLNLRSDCSP